MGTKEFNYINVLRFYLRKLTAPAELPGATIHGTRAAAQDRSAHLPDVPEGAVPADDKDFQPSVAVRAGGQAVGCADLRRRCAQTVPRTPVRLHVDLPSMPKSAIV